MRKLLILVGVLVVVHVALLFVRVSGAAQPAGRDAVKVGIVLDVGGLGDKSFNDGAYRGAVRAEQELGARVRLIEPGEGTDREAGLRLLAAEKMDIVIAVGFIFTDDVTQLAKEYPNTNFADVDYSLSTDKAGNLIPPPPNVAALKFKEEEGSFLVGALAALVGQSKKVGFVGGMDVPLIWKFEAGYKAGVKAVCPDCTVVTQYAGVTPDAFRNPGKGKELALNQYQQGVNVIYHASGSTGLGVFEAARQTGKYAIGVDADQYAEAPGSIDFHSESLFKTVVPIPASVATLRTRFEDDVTLKRLILIVSLLESDETPKGAMRAGFEAYVRELRAAFKDEFPNLFQAESVNDEEGEKAIIKRIKDRVESKTKSAIEGALSTADKVKIKLGFLDNDDFISSENIKFGENFFLNTPNATPITLVFQKKVAFIEQVFPPKVAQGLVRYHIRARLQAGPPVIDPCRSQATAVKTAQTVVDGIQKEINLLAKAFPKGSNNTEIQRIRKEELAPALAELEKAKKALQLCRSQQG